MQKQEWLASKLICRSASEPQCVVIKRLDGYGIIAESGCRATSFAPLSPAEQILPPYDRAEENARPLHGRSG